MIVVTEYYLQRVLDTQIYQTVLEVKMGDQTILYTHEERLWSELYIEDLRASEKSKAREHVINVIRNKLFKD